MIRVPIPPNIQSNPILMPVHAFSLHRFNNLYVLINKLHTIAYIWTETCVVCVYLCMCVCVHALGMDVCVLLSFKPTSLCVFHVLLCLYALVGTDQNYLTSFGPARDYFHVHSELVNPSGGMYYTILYMKCA